MRFLFYRWLFFFGNSVYDRYLRVILQDMGTPDVKNPHIFHFSMKYSG